MPPGLATILVVDDDEMNRDMLSRRLQRHGYDVAVGIDGDQAIAMVRENRFDLVLLDVMMPGIDGFEVLSILRRDLSPTDLPIIMATAKDGSEDIVRALGLGANDYVTKPIDFAVTLARLQTQLSLKRAVEQVKSLERSLSSRNRELEATNVRMSRDLQSAARIQEAFLPHHLPEMPGLTFAWTFRPCDELAGDGLSVVALCEGKVGLYVLDVSSHGVASALLSVNMSRLLSGPAEPASILLNRDIGSGADRVVSPAVVADRLNSLFPFEEATEQFATLVYGVLDTATNEFRYTSAGHPGPVLVPREGEPTIFDGEGYPIGLAGEDYQERSIQLAAGDRLVLYSDGVPEAMSPDGRLFGADRMCEALGRGRRGPLQDGVLLLREEVERWCAAAGLKDDVSILALEISAAATSATEPN